jgi:hypothetical protein
VIIDFVNAIGKEVTLRGILSMVKKRRDNCVFAYLQSDRVSILPTEEITYERTNIC